MNRNESKNSWMDFLGKATTSFGILAFLAVLASSMCEGIADLQAPPAPEDVVVEPLKRIDPGGPLVIGIETADAGSERIPPPSELQGADVIIDDEVNEKQRIGDAALAEIATIMEPMQGTGRRRFGQNPPKDDDPAPLTPEQQKCWDRYEDELELLVSDALHLAKGKAFTNDVEFIRSLVETGVDVAGDHLEECLDKCPVTGIDWNAETDRYIVINPNQPEIPHPKRCFQAYLDSPERPVYGVKPYSLGRLSDCLEDRVFKTEGARSLLP